MVVRPVREFCVKQKGQAIVAALVIMLLSVSGLVLMYNTGQATSEKLKVVNAADAAAYSGSLWIARQLNFMAYTNRAMIANHVSVGHFVSFTSWIRNTEQNIVHLNRIATVFPPLRAFTQIARNVTRTYRNVTEQFGRVYVPAVNLFNQGLYASQIAARVNLNGFVVNQVMRRTAGNYDDNIQVNDGDDLLELSQRSLRSGNTSRAARAAETVIGQFEALFLFTDIYDAVNDRGRAAGLVETSLDSSEPWIRGNRGWRFCLDGTRCRRFLPNHRLSKRGNTVHSVDGGTDQSRRNDCSFFSRFFGRNADNNGGEGLNWYSRDETQLEHVRVRRFRLRWSTIFRTCADANATEFSSSYRGIDNYYALRNQNREHQTLSIFAYATLDANESSVPVYHTFRETNPSDPQYEVKRRQAITSEKTTALVEAQVFHGNEEEFLLTDQASEYSNLFNPYWHARSTFGTYDRIASVIAGIND